MHLRNRTNGLTSRALALLAGLSFAAPASAVVLYGSSQRNTTPPGSLSNHGTNHTPGGPNDPRRLLNSGWQWQVQFENAQGPAIGTAIAPQYFITAAHLGGPGNSTVTLNGTTYNIDSTFNAGIGTPGWADDDNSDLRIWKITGTFPSHAQVYNEPLGSEVNRPLVVFGRGTQRGAEVRVNGQLKGWQWGPRDGALSWGENNVEQIVNFGAGFGSGLRLFFDADGGPNEAALTDRDSGGGLFIRSGGAWKLAGINLAVDGPWRFDAAGTPFNASIFDAGGLWVGNNPQFIPDGSVDVPGSSYSTSISANLAWVQSVVGPGVVPEPSAGLALLALTPLLRRSRK
jgi:hypothetical protein